MRHLRITRLLTAVLGPLGVLFLTGLSSCGGSAAGVTRNTSTVTPIVVLTAIGGGASGEDIGGLDDGYPVNDVLIESWPCDLKAQVFLPSGVRNDDGSLVGSAISQAGKVHFEVIEDNGEDEVGSWFAVKSDVNLGSDATATYHNFNGVDGCPSSFRVRARFVPSTLKGGTRRSNGEALTESDSTAFQNDFRMGTTTNPFVDAYVTVEQGRGGNSEETFPLNLENGRPSSIPGTRAEVGDDGSVEVFPIHFTLHIGLKGVHHYTLLGTSHISSAAGEASDDDFAIPMDVESCSEPEYFTVPFTGTSPKGQGPLLSHLRLGGSTWEIGDPHADKTGPAPTPNQQPTAQLNGFFAGGTNVNWDASASSDPDGFITSYGWDWTNDGSIDFVSAGPAAAHTYGFSGNVTARVVVTDNGGATAQATKTVFIPGS